MNTRLHFCFIATLVSGAIALLLFVALALSLANVRWPYLLLFVYQGGVARFLYRRARDLDARFLNISITKELSDAERWARDQWLLIYGVANVSLFLALPGLWLLLPATLSR